MDTCDDLDWVCNSYLEFDLTRECVHHDPTLVGGNYDQPASGIIGGDDTISTVKSAGTVVSAGTLTAGSSSGPRGARGPGSTTGSTTSSVKSRIGRGRGSIPDETWKPKKN